VNARAALVSVLTTNAQVELVSVLTGGAWDTVLSEDTSAPADPRDANHPPMSVAGAMTPFGSRATSPRRPERPGRPGRNKRAGRHRRGPALPPAPPCRAQREARRPVALLCAVRGPGDPGSRAEAARRRARPVPEDQAAIRPPSGGAARQGGPGRRAPERRRNQRHQADPDRPQTPGHLPKGSRRHGGRTRESPRSDPLVARGSPGGVRGCPRSAPFSFWWWD